MSRIRPLPSVLLALCSLMPWPGQAQTPPLQALRSTSIALPQDDSVFPPGPEVDAINNNCLSCHSAGMVLTQPTLPKATWEAEVQKMINVYKAPVAAEDVPAIVAYLDGIKGTRPAMNPAH